MPQEYMNRASCALNTAIEGWDPVSLKDGGDCTVKERECFMVLSVKTGIIRIGCHWKG